MLFDGGGIADNTTLIFVKDVQWAMKHSSPRAESAPASLFLQECGLGPSIDQMLGPFSLVADTPFGAKHSFADRTVLKVGPVSIAAGSRSCLVGVTLDARS